MKTSYDYDDGNLTANYISVPLLLKLYISGLNIYFGAQASYLIGGDYADSDNIFIH